MHIVFCVVCVFSEGGEEKKLWNKVENKTELIKNGTKLKVKRQKLKKKLKTKIKEKRTTLKMKQK